LAFFISPLLLRGLRPNWGETIAIHYAEDSYSLTK